MSMRLWHQSYGDLSQLPGYAAMLREHARSVCAPDTVVDVHGVEMGSLSPGVYHKHSGQGDHLRVTQIIENALRAEREGYDAVAVSCFLDPGLEDARGTLGIPIVSSLETALEVASKFGHAFGLITHAKWMNARLRPLIRQYNYEDRVVALEAIDFSMGLQELDTAFAGSQEFIDEFTRQASRLIRSGVDVIIPAEGVLNTVLVRNAVREIEGIPVLDAYGALLSYAEILVQIHRRSGLAVERPRVSDPYSDQLRRATAALLLGSNGPA